MKQITFYLFSIALAWEGCAQKGQWNENAIGGPCEDCQLMFEGMPSQLTSTTNLAPPDEPGEQLEISGTIYQQDGKTPAAGVVLYMYHTDSKGLYSAWAFARLGKDGCERTLSIQYDSAGLLS
jgi:hypothetical protein